MSTSSAAQSLSDTDRPLLGIALMLGFCALIPLGDAVAKILSTRIPVGQIVLARFAAQGLILAPVALMLGISLRLPSRVMPKVILRTLLQMAGITAMFMALRYLPLADAVAIAFVMPFIMLLLGKYVLKEEVGLRRLLACVVGFAGTLLVIQPSFAEVGLNALWPLAVAVIFSVFMMVTRTLARDTDPIAIQAVSGGIACLLMAGFFALGYGFSIEELNTTLPATPELKLLALAGVLGTIAHLLMTWSLRYAPTSTLASMQYLEIPVAVFVGWLVFSELPNSIAACGIALTVAAGLYAVLRERQVNRAAREVNPAATTESGLPASPE
ncbi:DMT family transporter [Tritonibacter scottomollicae]|uniref:Threonine/homoserine efflux transporter RhtA n=1 Tax=Tritonibacter scottomollicae TaxID=483013 RepID=A0A2T1AK18_TRISK|nr:DMT family transporter [Tritonibacter scottomollicae]PRZ48903.1 threonine/homoserine efflux transporter RhtA [Tritonibacter scottomollicae]